MMKLKFSNKLFFQVLVGNPWSLVTRSFCPSSWSDLHFRSEQAVIITSLDCTVQCALGMVCRSLSPFSLPICLFDWCNFTANSVPVCMFLMMGLVIAQGFPGLWVVGSGQGSLIKYWWGGRVVLGTWEQNQRSQSTVGVLGGSGLKVFPQVFRRVY